MKRLDYRPSRWTLRPGRLLAWIAGRLLRLIGWRVEGSLPDVPKVIAIGAFHTSNWDFPIMMLAAIKLRLSVNWIGKDGLFRWPFGRLMRALGGIPIRRDSSHNAVEQVIESINAHDTIFLVIAPEGTRRYVDHWKTGFYWMAHGAGVPIMLTYINYQRKVIGVGELFYPTGDIEADFARLREFYSTHAAGRYGKQEGAIVIRPRSTTSKS